MGIVISVIIFFGIIFVLSICSSQERSQGGARGVRAPPLGKKFLEGGTELKNYSQELKVLLAGEHPPWHISGYATGSSSPTRRDVTNKTNVNPITTAIQEIISVDKGIYCYKTYLSYILRWNPEWLDEIGIILRILITIYMSIIRQMWTPIYCISISVLMVDRLYLSKNVMNLLVNTN